MKKVLRVADYLEHISWAIERISRYTSGLNEVGFLNNELVQDDVVRNIEISGEASNKIMLVAASSADRHQDIIPWKVMYAMHNRVSHAYQQVEMVIVWKTIQSDLANLYIQIQSGRAKLSDENTNSDS